VSPTERPHPGVASGGHLPTPTGDARDGADRRTVLHPEGWPRPKGYAYGVVAEGRHVCLSGIIGWDEQGRINSDDFVAQVRQALTNILALLREAHATPGDIVRMTWYVVDKHEYLDAQSELGEAYRAVLGRHFPAMTVVEVSGLLEDRARVEIEVTAVIGR
jgi:enamine deaminase RidA (YjgF/YER057c/UK114 family)